jgi:hypothetical protein
LSFPAVTPSHTSPMFILLSLNEGQGFMGGKTVLVYSCKWRIFIFYKWRVFIFYKWRIFIFYKWRIFIFYKLKYKNPSFIKYKNPSFIKYKNPSFIKYKNASFIKYKNSSFIKYKNPSFIKYKNPSFIGLAVDQQGHVYIGGAHDIHRLSPDGTFRDIVLSKHDGVRIYI